MAVVVPKTLTLNSSALFLDAYRSFSTSSPSPATPPPVPFDLLSNGSPLPSVPPDFPLSKIIPKTRFVVDGFRSSGEFSVSYFLSHFHSDHYAGLGVSWCKGIIFCSETTARFLVEILKVPPFFVFSLQLDVGVEIDGWEVTLVDANHCPGAVQFLFRVHGAGAHQQQQLEKYVHTGDFRFCEQMKSSCALREFVGADAVFLDTTYCNPKFVFPSQEESVNYIVNAIEKFRNQSGSTGEPILFLIATYVIGKERILFEISRRCGCSLHVDARKMEILSILGYGDSEFFTEDPSKTNIHVIGWNLLGDTWPYFRPNYVKMKEIMSEKGYTKAVGFVATGWTYETKRDGFAVRVKDSLEIHLVPYSEHSNYDELREYVKFLRPKRVIPTVGMEVEKLDSKHSLALQKHFAGLVDETANKQEFLMAFHLKPSEVRPESNLYTDNSMHDISEEGVNQTDSAEQSTSFNSDALDLEKIDEIAKEIQDCLPHWVTRDQILALLRRSDNDIVKAVSDFFEHETEFYELANARSHSDPVTQNSEDNNLDNSLTQAPKAGHSLDLTLKSTQKTFDAGSKNHLFQVVCSTHNISKNSSQSKKRSVSSSNKAKKKGKSSPNPQATGSSQSKITRFFGKIATTNFSNITSIAHHHLEKEEPVKGNDCDSYNLELDRFLQIINNGIPRNSAAAILENTKGDLDLAVDMYYSKLDNVNKNDESLLLQVDVPSGDANSSVNKLSRPIGKANVSTLYLQGSSRNDSTAINVSLPIEKYLPIEHACWESGQPAPYLLLARTFDLVEREKGKIKTTIMLCNMFRSLLALSPDDVLSAVYLCTNKIAADHKNMELNIGGSLVVTALEEACGTSRSRIKEMYNISGDLGDVAQEIRQTQSLLAPPPPLTIGHLFDTLRKISMISGSGSSQQRKNLIVNILRSCREMEMKFLVRTLVRNLRIGAMMKTILPALAQAVVLNSFALQRVEAPDNIKVQLQVISAEVAEAYNVLPNLDMLIPSLVKQGINFSSSSLEVVPGTPVPPMLARITNGVTQVLKLFQGKAFTCEYKYDGQRAQIHRLADGSIRVFSRQMKESTLRFPDLTQIIKELTDNGPSSFILDSEVVAIDRKNGCKLMAFQELSSRERGGKDFSIQLENIKVDICVFVFDIVLLNGERLLDTPLRQRRKYIKDLFKEERIGYMEFAKEITVESDEACLSKKSTLSKINSFFEDACNSSCEGIVVKTLDVNAGYYASKRSDAWLKVKRDYVEGLGDSLDLVPIGAWHGNGRKAGWYSPFLMACYNPDTEEFQSVCRVMSGFTDDFYIQMKAFFSDEKLLPKKPAYYTTDEVPDFWFSAELVWEIRGADLTLSPVHHAARGMLHPSRGISVRLPRYVCSRPDKQPEDCSTAADIAEMYTSQTRKIDVDKGD